MSQKTSHSYSEERDRQARIYAKDIFYSCGAEWSYPHFKSFIVGRRILDLGCGKGWLSRKLKSHDLEVTSIDWVPVYREGIEADITKPLELSEHDTSIAAHVIHHIMDGDLATFFHNMACARRVIFTFLNRPFVTATQEGCELNIKNVDQWSEIIAGYFNIIHVLHMPLPGAGHYLIVANNGKEFTKL